MRTASSVMSMLAACLLAAVVPAQSAPSPATESRATAASRAQDQQLHGRIEEHDGLRVLRVWGTPAERGYAHGLLLADDVARLLRLELTARFARRQPLLRQLRAAVDRLIEYPDDVVAELDALWQGVLDSGVDRDMPELERACDRTDLLVSNALDVFGMMGCSSFTVWGQQAVGGGVLTARNFDWPLTGDHMLDGTILCVQHLPNGQAVASVTWAGYVGTVTGINRDGMAAYLHVGSGKISYTPQPSSWPSAIAARNILELGAAAGADAVFRKAQRLLEYTSPPAGFLTHVVLPTVPAAGPPVAVFETDVDECVRAAPAMSALVLTNHFLTRKDGRMASKDSIGRQQRMEKGIAGCIAVDDRKVDPEEAWRILASVQRGGNHAFGTLHALVFRHQPWLFELRLAQLDDRGVVAAPSSERCVVLTREQVFGDGKPLGGHEDGR